MDHFSRARRASSPHTPEADLIALMSDPEVAVRASLLGNTEFPKASAETLAREWLDTAQKSDWVMPQAIAWSTRVSEGILRRVADEHPHWYVWIALANNENCPHDLLVRFADGDNPFREVRNIAKARLL